MGCGTPIAATSTSNFSDGELIGKGGFGNVKQVGYVPNGQLYASKVLDVRRLLSCKGGANSLMGELQSLKRISGHPFLSNLHFAYHDWTKCYLVLDLLEGGDIRHHIKAGVTFTEKQATFIVACIALALRHIHSRGVIHRDVKPENIVLDRQLYPRLVDFGISYRSLDDDDMNGIVCNMSSGTYPYMAPEIFTKSHSHGHESDFWSLGLVMYEMLFRCLPFGRRCPRSFINYSRLTYDTVYWSRRLNQHNVEGCYVSNKCIHDTHSYTEYPLLRLPDTLSSGLPLSSDCGAVLRGLVDVRITHRLGTNFENLQRMPLFDSLDCSWDELLHVSVPSPLDVDISIVAQCLRTKYNINGHVAPTGRHDKSNPIPLRAPSHIPAYVRELLEGYSYTAPEHIPTSSKANRYTFKKSSSTASTVSTCSLSD